MGPPLLSSLGRFLVFFVNLGLFVSRIKVRSGVSSHVLEELGRNPFYFGSDSDYDFKRTAIASVNHTPSVGFLWTRLGKNSCNCNCIIMV